MLHKYNSGWLLWKYLTEIVMQYIDVKQQFKVELLASKVAARGEREESLVLTMFSKIMEDIGKIRVNIRKNCK